DPGTERLERPIVEVIWRRGFRLERLDETHQAFLHNFGRQSIRVCLEWVRRRGLLRVDGRKPFVCFEGIRQQTGDKVLRVLVLQMDQVTGAVESKSILREGAAQAAEAIGTFEDDRRVFTKMVAGAQSCETATNNNDLVHDVMSTFIRR